MIIDMDKKRVSFYIDSVELIAECPFPASFANKKLYPFVTNNAVTDQFDINLSRWMSIPVLGVFVPYAAFVWFSIRADRIHSFCDRGILPTWRFMQYNRLEILAYRLLGIRVFLWTYGADVRSRIRTLALGTPNCCMDCTIIGKACICDDDVQIRYMAWLHRNVTAVFSQPEGNSFGTFGAVERHFLKRVFDSGLRYTPKPGLGEIWIIHLKLLLLAYNNASLLSETTELFGLEWPVPSG